MMVLLIVIFSGLAMGLLCYAYLQKRQRQAQRIGVKARFLNASASPERERELRLQKLPFVGSALKQKQRLRVTNRCEAELPRMFDIIAMGMHAGLSFDASFGLYVNRFENELALLCRERFEVWERGLISRNEGLEQLALAVNLPIFDRFCRTVSRSIRYGVSMAPLIKEYAEQARREYRNKQKELVLKAPVKMLIPTGVLILPAMMMLVIGPILLDVTGRMV
ncbi:MAG: type II secretion system F family protein [Coriobacteriia bacterium]|nr:type II secretion system F family protein [Coriobacteriia bacterium]MCL2750269.1 type II secretion system F family protein [Coriobacteriia bacterium]